MFHSCQNTNSVKGQIKYLVYCMENAIHNLGEGVEQMVWLIDFQGWSMGSISLKVTRETAHILQDHYPERLGLGILYNPPKMFQSFWMIVRPFIEAKTYKKVKFVYSDNPDSQKIMEELFDLDKLEPGFGGRNPVKFDYNEFEKRMLEDDKKFSACITSEKNMIHPQDQHIVAIPQPLDSSLSGHRT
uniref:Random slug protein 5 n=1 Tax=Anthurium amnicola TaxID=1678845 RepID=A0A1D1YJI4_9ARAE